MNIGCVSRKESAPYSIWVDAKRAIMLVADRYAVPLGLSCPTDHIHKLFHFVEAKRWAYYLRHVARFNVPKEFSEKVEGVTHSYADSPIIGINKSYYTFGTLVHESVHFFSHHAFRKAFKVDKYEGATEYLTRSLLDDFGPRQDVHGQNDMYARELFPFLSILNSDADRQQLCRAYFNGENNAILQIGHRVNRFQGND